ncbi:unnamed protein product [Tetraodon nigroviridis]|uniref:(spotted green pufferfish) hypothetical protein n=1 Tax=Tetraodon nigroviridis TaxID=99883 RepID=Q4SLV9_TETNG|nr:unnamed protein product [Tetraodon nigroviridis]
MKGSQLHAQAQKGLAMEWRDRAIHLILSKSTQLPKDHSRTQERRLRHPSGVALHKNSALLYHREKAGGPGCCRHTHLKEGFPQV